MVDEDLESWIPRTLACEVCKRQPSRLNKRGNNIIRMQFCGFRRRHAENLVDKSEVPLYASREDKFKETTR